MLNLKNKRQQWIDLGAFTVMVLVNICAEVLPIGGRTTREISAMYPTPLTPAPYAFSIWSVIYLLLLVYLILQFRTDEPPLPGVWFAVSCIANISWIVFWHTMHIGLALLSILVLLFSLMMIEDRLRVPGASDGRQWTTRIPFSLYYGWITVASIANISVWLKSIGFSGFGLPPQMLTSLAILLGGAIISAGIWLNRDTVYGLAGLWGYIGILSAQLTADNAGRFPIWSVAALIISCIAMVVVGTMTRCGAEMNLPRCLRITDTPH